jgi:hypothetical protein
MGTAMNTIGTRGFAAHTAASPGYRDAIDGLKSFDQLSRALHGRRDDIMRGLVHAPAYPQPGNGSPVAAGSALGAAVSAFVQSEGGRAAIERAVSAAGAFLKGAFAGGPTQLPLPFE